MLKMHCTYRMYNEMKRHLGCRRIDRLRESLRPDGFKVCVGRRLLSPRQWLHDGYGRYGRSQAPNAGARAKRCEPQHGSLLCARDRAHIVRRRHVGARMATNRFPRASSSRSSRGYGHRRGSSRRLVGSEGASRSSGVTHIVLIGGDGKAAGAMRPKREWPRTPVAWILVDLSRIANKNRLNRGPGRDRFCGVMDHAQLELFADRRPTPSATNSGATRRLVPEHLSDAALIAALPEASLAEDARSPPRRGGGDLAMR